MNAKEDEKLRALFGALKAEEAPEELYARISAQARHRAQDGAAPARPQAFLRFFGEWSYALELKCAALAVIALAGFFAGEADWRRLGHETFYSAIVTGDISWEN